MKVRFYIDLPEYGNPDYLCATAKMPSHKPPDGWTRVAFDVDFPPEVLKEHDVKAPAEFKGKV